MLHDPLRPAAPAGGRESATTAATPAADPDASTCSSYAPGHLMHYRHQSLALRSPGVAAAEVTLEGTSVRIVLDTGEVLDWRHHDPERLGRMLDLVLGPRVVYREHHALRVGPYWFNCAPGPEAWTDCSLG